MLSRSFMPASSPQDLLAYTPMLHARLFNETPKFRHNHFQPLREPLSSAPDFHSFSPPPEGLYLDGNPKFDRPLFAQFCANDPDEFLSAAKHVAPFCDAVDLNLGCPQGIARKGKYGAFLQEDQELIFNLISKLHKELDVPITAKLRILETKEKSLEYVKNVIRAGASIVTVHGRTRDMKGHKTGLADWKVIKWLREQIPREVVMFANGNILKKEDINRCLEETGVDGVMSAEGNLYDPAIFSTPPPIGEEGREYWRGKDGKGGWRMDAVLRRYMDIIYRYVMEVPPPPRAQLYLPSDPEPERKPTLETEIHEQKRPREEDVNGREGPPKKKQKSEKKEKTQNPNFLAMQPHLFHLLRSLVSRHHNVRDALAKCRAGDISAFENVLRLVEMAVKQGLKEYEETNGRSWEEELAKDARLNDIPKELESKDINGNGEGEEMDERYESSLETVRACKRPWWVVQPYVRPLPKEALAKGSLTLSKKDKAKMEREAVTAKQSKSAPYNGHMETGTLGDTTEKVEAPKDGLVCS
jgi:tRNA-dihydrouridine synthase 1